jgi:hypothetical protein
MGRRRYISLSIKSHTGVDSKMWVSASIARSMFSLPPRSISKSVVPGHCGHSITDSQPPVKRAVLF